MLFLNVSYSVFRVRKEARMGYRDGEFVNPNVREN